MLVRSERDGNSDALGVLHLPLGDRGSALVMAEE